MAVEALAWKLSGCLVRELDPSGAVAKDGRIKTGILANILLQCSVFYIGIKLIL